MDIPDSLATLRLILLTSGQKPGSANILCYHYIHGGNITFHWTESEDTAAINGYVPGNSEAILAYTADHWD